MMQADGVKTLAVTTIVGLAHLMSGIVALASPAALYVTPLAGFVDLTKMAGLSHNMAGVILIVVGFAAIAASRFSFRGRILLLIPQQALLLMQIWSISLAMASGVYPDGYIPTGGGAFVLNDQIWPWLLTISHSAWLAAFIWHGVRRDGVT